MNNLTHSSTPYASCVPLSSLYVDVLPLDAEAVCIEAVLYVHAQCQCRTKRVSIIVNVVRWIFVTTNKLLFPHTAHPGQLVVLRWKLCLQH